MSDDPPIGWPTPGVTEIEVPVVDPADLDGVAGDIDPDLDDEVDG